MLDACVAGWLPMSFNAVKSRHPSGLAQDSFPSIRWDFTNKSTEQQNLNVSPQKPLGRLTIISIHTQVWLFSEILYGQNRLLFLAFMTEMNELWLQPIIVLV